MGSEKFFPSHESTSSKSSFMGMVEVVLGGIGRTKKHMGQYMNKSCASKWAFLVAFEES